MDTVLMRILGRIYGDSNTASGYCHSGVPGSRHTQPDSGSLFPQVPALPGWSGPRYLIRWTWVHRGCQGLRLFPTVFIIVRHILPNAVGTIIVQATMAVAAQILNTAALSYLGLGPAAAGRMGSMLPDAKEYIRYSVWGILFPGLTMQTIALSLNLVGDGLRMPWTQD